MAKADSLRENRVPIMMSDDELKAIDDWRFANRIATRSDAVRKLCQLALLFDQKSSAVFNGIMVLVKMRTDALKKSIELKTDNEFSNVEELKALLVRHASDAAIGQLEVLTALASLVLPLGPSISIGDQDIRSTLDLLSEAKKKKVNWSFDVDAVMDELTELGKLQSRS